MVLVVVAREKEAEESHNRYMFGQVKKELDEKKISYETLDLYEENFDPVLYTTRERDDLEKYEALIDNHDKFIFIYPIWWNAPPAILKGFLEAVFHAGFAFHYEKTIIPGVGRPIGHFTDKKAVTLTTSGAPTWLFCLYQRKRGVKIVNKDVLGMAGMRTKNYHVGGAQKLTDKNKRKIKQAVKKATTWI
mgnify:CR=1 FL=1